MFNVVVYATTVTVMLTNVIFKEFKEILVRKVLILFFCLEEVLPYFVTLFAILKDSGFSYIRM